VVSPRPALSRFSMPRFLLCYSKRTDESHEVYDNTGVRESACL
jgi:hypothetical protein